jgi:hypothetical protein
MTFFAKLLLANLVIITCAIIGRSRPSLAGLIATMPLTSLVVLFWLHHDRPADTRGQAGYVAGVFWGVLPTLFFFGIAWLQLRRGATLPAALATGTIAWLAGAICHQQLLR